MKNFYPGTHAYDVAEQIYLCVGTKPFMYRDIAGKFDVTPGNLTRLRSWGAVRNPTPAEEVDERHLPDQSEVRYWVLTPIAIQTIRRYRGESDREDFDHIPAGFDHIPAGF